jgi:zinc transport system permease protein
MITAMIDTFILNALLAGTATALACGPLGCFVVWQRMAYYGDTIAHAALLGIVLALVFNIWPGFGIMIVAAFIAVMIWRMESKTRALDTLLGIAAHGSLALGLVILGLSKSIVVDINGLLFGDILAVSAADLIFIYALPLVTGLAIFLNWGPLMRTILHSDVAQVEGIDVRRQKLLLMLMIAFTVAISIKIVGILLITALLIIPAASARYFSHTPKQMVLLSAAAGVISVCMGLYASLAFDTPSGPSIVVAALVLFLTAHMVKASK